MAGRAIFFAPIGDGRRQRQGFDGVQLIFVFLAVLCGVLVSRFESHEWAARVSIPAPWD